MHVVGYIPLKNIIGDLLFNKTNVSTVTGDSHETPNTKTVNLFLTLLFMII